MNQVCVSSYQCVTAESQPCGLVSKCQAWVTLLRVYPGPLIGHWLPLLASDWLVVTWADQAGPG